MPHYHAQEATRAVKKVLGNTYKMERKPIALAVLDCMRDCEYVKQSGNGIFRFKGYFTK